MTYIPWLVSSIVIFVLLFSGIFLIFVKTKRNKRVGVKISYAYISEETWRYTNRVFGIVCLIVGLLQIPIIYPIYALYLDTYFLTVCLSVGFSQALLLSLTFMTLLTISTIKDKKERVIIQQQELQ